MRRKDGKSKIRSPRNSAHYEFGFRNNPDNNLIINKNWHSDTADPTSTTVMSFFSGCGGLDLGLLGGFSVYGKSYQSLPFSIVNAFDNSSDAVDAYRLNLSEHAECEDLTEIDHGLLPSAEVLIGGFPCQDFSSSGPKTGFGGRRGMLYQVMIAYIRKHKPKVVIGENVAHLGRLSNGDYLKKILLDLRSEGYKVEVWEIYGPDYSLPQSRRRLFIVGVRNDLPGFPEKPIPTHKSKYFTVDEALKDLEAISDETVTNQSQYFLATKATSGGGQGDHSNKAGSVSYCIRANARGRIQFHYALDRRLTVRECARLQSFPDTFVFPYSTQRNLTLIGNAVPPILGHAIGVQLSRYFEALSTGTVENVHSSVFEESVIQTKLELVV